MNIRDYDLDIDIYEELQEFDWTGGVIKGSKFICCSPFRTERHPSFAVNLETGTFIDSGNSDEHYHKGNFIKLLALLRQESYDIIEDYLIEKYSTILEDTDALQLRINLSSETTKKFCFEKELLQQIYIHNSDYLTKRGIAKEVQDMFGIGYNLETKSIAMPWTDLQGRIINVKYRRTDTKAFYYEKEGQPIKDFVYGLYQCKLQKAKRVFLCESEIDALTFWTHGYTAIAVGGSSLSKSQKRLILSIGIEEIVLATDNDKVGRRFRAYLQEEFIGHIKVLMYILPDGKKDINELSQLELLQSATTLKSNNITIFNLNI